MPRRTSPTPWFNCTKVDPQPRMRLFCFPYAGAGSSVYRGWSNSLPPGVEVWPVQLPGRGSRYKESPYTSMRSLVSALADAIRPFLDIPFSFFGHSLGAMMSFELAHRLSHEFDMKVTHLFVSGARAPHLPRSSPNIHHLPDEQFITKLGELNGTPQDVLENAELLRMMMMTLRADFELAETYASSNGRPLACPITALGGLEDDLVPPEDLKAWMFQTTSSFDFWLLPGDHFFLHTCDSLLFQILSQAIRRVINADLT